MAMTASCTKRISKKFKLNFFAEAALARIISAKAALYEFIYFLEIS
jgi:hypothetical protein